MGIPQRRPSGHQPWISPDPSLCQAHSPLNDRPEAEAGRGRDAPGRHADVAKSLCSSPGSVNIPEMKLAGLAWKHCDRLHGAPVDGRASAHSLLGLRDRPGSVDQLDMAEGLWIVAQELPTLWVHLLGEQDHVVDVGDRLLEPSPRQVPLARSSSPASASAWASRNVQMRKVRFSPSSPSCER